MTNEEQNIVAYLVELLCVPAKKNRCGELLKEFKIILKDIALKELNLDFEELIKTKSLSFCGNNPSIIYPKMTKEAMVLWKNNSTGNIQGIEVHNKFMNYLCSQVEKKLHYKTTCSLYFSRNGSKTFHPHYDIWKGLLVQVIGNKDFKVYKNENTCSSFEKYTLTENKWLRLDPDDYHEGISDDFSVHFNIAVHEQFAC